MYPIPLTRAQVERLRLARLAVVPGDGGQRWRLLRESYRASTLWRKDRYGGACFGCESAKSCDHAFAAANKSRQLPSFARGTVANYFADGYDRIRTGSEAPLRIVVVSIDSGVDKPGLTNEFEKQTEMDVGSRLDFRNRHWKETRQLVHYILFGEWESETDENRLSLGLFVHTRAIKCTAGRSGWTRPPGMYQNCLRHLQPELAILQPTVLLAQGYGNGTEFGGSVIDSVTQVMDAICGMGTDVANRLVPDLAQNVRFVSRAWAAPWGDVVMLGGDHPSAMAPNQYRLTKMAALRPAIARLRETGFSVSQA